jgi:pimeloyl-ACP methyl ester carboxylesterase
MLRKYVDSRERYYHGRDMRRQTLPFEWGLEHLGLETAGDPQAALLAFARNALIHSESFFRCEPAADYDYDGQNLKFQSAVVTPYPENNTVWGRMFEGGKDLAVVVLPQWNCDWDGHVGLCRALQRAGVTTLRLSMPYHHFRKPPELERAEFMVSANLGRTIAASRQAVLDARRAGDWLQSQGYRRLAILGTSIGSSIAFLTFAHDDRFEAGVFIHVSAFFADVVWRGLSTEHIRQALGNFVDLDTLRKIWAPISPQPFAGRIAGTRRRMLMFAGRYDPTFLPDLSQLAFDEFDRSGVPYKLHWLPCGHYSMGEFPFSMAVGYRIVNFLKSMKNGALDLKDHCP